MNSFRFLRNEALGAKGMLSFEHSGTLTASGAFLKSEKLKATIKLPRNFGATDVSLILYNETEEEPHKIIKAIWCGISGSCDIYKVSLAEGALSCGLYFFIVRMRCIYGTLYGYKAQTDISFSYNFKREDNFQISISDFKYTKPSHIYGGIIYHIFVDRFKRVGDYKPKDNTVFVSDWNAEIPEYSRYPGAPIKNNYFYGGTLDGVTSELDYIKSLGANIIYLSPIFDAYSNHKYDTGDYMTVDQMFGGNAALERLLKAAKEKDMYVILDGVFNHTGSDSIYFNQNNTYKSIGACQSKSSPYYSWYQFTDYPIDYESWWGIKTLPKINPDNDSCRSFFTGSDGVIEKYTKMGILGFRLDVVDELSDDFVANIKSTMNSINQNTVLYGEVWEDGSNKIAYNQRKKYYLGEELDGVMNYPIRKGIIDFLRYKSTDALKYALTDIINNAPKRIRDAQMNLLGSHDTVRAITAIYGESPEGKSNEELLRKFMSMPDFYYAKQKMMSAYTILATLPGIPSIFYGDEAGLEGYQDPFNRRTYPWGYQDTDLIQFYKKIGKIRRENDIYKEGDFNLLHISDNLLIFERKSKSFSLITIVNNSDKDITFEFSSTSTALISGAVSFEHTLSPNSTEIFKVKSKTLIEF